MNNLMEQTKYTLGIINPSDLMTGVRGGSTGFLSNILPYLSIQKVIVFGIGLNGATPWKPSYLLKNIKFVPICNLRYPSKVPMRLTFLLYYIRYRKRILDSGVDILYIHSPECCLPFLYSNANIPVIYHQQRRFN